MQGHVRLAQGRGFPWTPARGGRGGGGRGAARSRGWRAVRGWGAEQRCRCRVGCGALLMLSVSCREDVSRSFRKFKVVNY